MKISLALQCVSDLNIELMAFNTNVGQHPRYTFVWFIETCHTWLVPCLWIFIKWHVLWPVCLFFLFCFVLFFTVNNEDKCGSSPCINDGTCITVGRSYQCDCRRGFYGRQCQLGKSSFDWNYRLQNFKTLYINKCVLKIYFQIKGLSDVEDDSLQFSSQSKFNPENIYDQMILIYA